MLTKLKNINVIEIKKRRKSLGNKEAIAMRRSSGISNLHLISYSEREREIEIDGRKTKVTKKLKLFRRHFFFLLKKEPDYPPWMTKSQMVHFCNFASCTFFSVAKCHFDVRSLPTKSFYLGSWNENDSNSKNLYHLKNDYCRRVTKLCENCLNLVTVFWEGIQEVIWCTNKKVWNWVQSSTAPGRISNLCNRSSSLFWPIVFSIMTD